jgi:hypothetical protein
MAAVFADQLLGELGGISEISVVCEANAVGRIPVERLRLRRCAVAARGGLTHVPDADVAFQIEHVGSRKWSILSQGNELKEDLNGAPDGGATIMRTRP